MMIIIKDAIVEDLIIEDDTASIELSGCRIQTITIKKSDENDSTDKAINP